MNTKGKNLSELEIYWGDEFQIEITNHEEALLIGLQINSYLKTQKLDVSMSLGAGDKNYTAAKISESN